MSTGVAQNPRSAEWYRNTYRDLSTSGKIATTDAGAAGVATVPDANHTIFIQKITVNILTLGAQSVTFQDSNGTPKVAGFIEASAAAGTIRTIDYGAKGYAMTEGKNFDISGTAAPGYTYVIECYARQTKTSQSTTTDRIF